MPELSKPGKTRTALAEAADATGGIVSGYVLLMVIMIVVAGAWAIFGPIEDQLMSKYSLQGEHNGNFSDRAERFRTYNHRVFSQPVHEKRVVLLNRAGEIIGGDEVTANEKHAVTKPTVMVADV